MTHESTVAFTVCTDGLLELSDFHLSRLEEAADLSTHLIAIEVDHMKAVIVVVDLDKRLRFFDFGSLAFGSWLFLPLALVIEGLMYGSR